MSTSEYKLFQPITVGDLTLNHRVVLAPLTRFRNDTDHVPLPPAAEYYAQRASVRGTLMITEATFIAAKAGGFSNAPGIYTPEQVEAWRKIVDGVHAKGSFIYLQLWALGCGAYPADLAKEDPSFPFVSASSIKLAADTTSVPLHALTIPEIKEYVQLYAKAAATAVYEAGFDGVEVHSANGFLLDQFVQDVSNHRTDDYGGSIENRTRFTLEVVDAVSKAVGEKKTGVRVSPWNRWQDMGMADPRPTFSHIATALRDRYPDLAYLHVAEQRINGPAASDNHPSEEESNDFLREIWGGRAYISAGGHTRQTGIEGAEKGDLVAYGRAFIANPDLPFRLQHDIPLTVGDRESYYAPGSIDPVGYTSYPFSKEFLETYDSGANLKAN